MAHDTPPTPPVAASSPRTVRALVGLACGVTYPFLVAGVVGYLLLTVVSRDISLMFTGALLALYGSVLSTALQARLPAAHAGTVAARPTRRGETDGAQ